MDIILGHYLFLEAHSLPRAKLSENCLLLGTDNVRGQISVHISRQMEVIVYKTTITKPDQSAYREFEASSFLSISLPSISAKYFFIGNFRKEG